LRRYIEDGGFAPGDRLPGEDELNEVFGVSQITTRKALDILVESGLIFRRRGKGTFVSDHPIRAQTEGGLDSDPEAPHDDTLLETTVFRQELVPVSNKTADLMQIQSGDELAMIERVRRADGHPFCVEKIFLVHARCPGILEHDLNHEPLGALLARIHGIVLSKTQQTVRGQSAGRDGAHHLQISASDPALVVERVSYTDDGTPIEFARLFYRADRYELHFETTTDRRRRLRPARGRLQTPGMPTRHRNGPAS
jgi:GntR family transcriptional regulator